MTTSKLRLAGLLATTALASGYAQYSYAQTPASTAVPGQLEEVVVTATRQSETVNRVPLAVTAVTQKSLDQQGISNVSDLQRIVPSLTVSSTGGVDQFTIRGIIAGGTGAGGGGGAPTTGVYLDDTPLTKRNQNGSGNTNGTPPPILFDLDRIEVLRGPQGTLYGGSSEGGTIRFITPTPSLTHYSAYVKGDFSFTHYGTPSEDGGVAIGGPIIQDKLGFRASVYGRYQGGYVDDVNPYVGGSPPVTIKDVNWEKQNSIRVELLWKPTERSSVLLAGYNSYDDANDFSNQWTLPDPYTNVQTQANMIASGWTVPANWGAVAPYCINYTGVAVTQPKAVSCTGPHTHMYPAQVFGPYNLQPYQYVGTASDDHGTIITTNHIYSLTLGYDFDHMSVKAITSYSHDTEHGVQWGTTNITQLFGGYANLLPADPTFRDAQGAFHPHTKRYGLTQELRFASSGDPKPFSWVAGVYYSHTHSFGTYENYDPTEDEAEIILGIHNYERYGVPTVFGNSLAHRSQYLTDTEVAAYGEGNYWITDKFKATAGVRISRTQFNYYQEFYGEANGFNVPTAANGGLTTGSATASPITPKFGLQYQVTDNDLIYVSAAKGFRAGGVNAPLPISVCGPALTTLGLTLADIPVTYGADSIWSYEAGAKLRLLDNKVQFNAALFRIDQSQLQQTISLGFSCGPTFVTNVGEARSQGVEIETQAKLFPGFTAGLSGSYDDAKFSTNTNGPTPLNGQPATVVVIAGEPTGVPKWTFNVSGRYEFALNASTSAYVRGDWTMIPSYLTASSQVGIPTYTPDTARQPLQTEINLRAGVTRGGLDMNLFVNNLLESRDGSFTANRTGCALTAGASCNVFSNYTPLTSISSYRPREIGVQMAYHY